MVVILVIVCNGYKMPHTEIIYRKIWYNIMIMFSICWYFKIGVAVCCSIKLKHFVDYWYIRDEVKYLFVLFLPMSLIMQADVFAMYFVDGYFTGIFGVVAILWTLISWYISTVWVYNQNELKRKKDNANTRDKQVGEQVELGTALQDARS